MKYYKDAQDRVYAYEEDGSQDAFIPAELTFISEAEADALRRPPLSDLIAQAHGRILNAYDAAIAELTADYPANEVASWPKQEAEARRFLADNQSEVFWLRGAANARGISVANLAALIVRNADALAPVYGQLTGKRQRLRDAINALGDAPTQEQLDAIQW